MAISVDWDTQVIFVPKADTTLIQALPEVRELDADTFRLALKDLEDDAEGMPFLDTHRHITESVLSGIAYGRTIEIINGYTIEFEDGTYGVTVVGANTNFLDVKVANQVSLLGNNSAGLVNLNPILARLLYQGTVFIDTVDGEAGIIIGENGIPSNPVDNLTDAVTIASTLGVQSLFIINGGITLNASFDAWSIAGAVGTTVALNGQSVDRAVFTTVSLSGAMTGSAMFRECMVNTVSGFQGEMTQTGIIGPLGIVGFTSMRFCHSDVAGTGQPVISFSNNVNSQLSLRNYTGGLNLQDIDNALNVASLDFNSGSLTLDSTVTDGTIVIRGIVGGLTDNSGPNVTIAQSGRVDPVAAQTSNFDGTVHIDALNGTSGTDYPLGLHDSPVDNTADALAIAANFGIEGIKIDGALPLTSGTFSPLNIVGNTALRDSVTVSATANVAQCLFKQLTVAGTVGQPAEWLECRMESTTITGGVLRVCAISNDMTLQGPYDVSMISCAETEPGLAEVTIDCGGGTFTGQLGIHEFYGAITIANKTGAEDYQIDIGSGTITIDSTVTAGTIRITGRGTLVDNSGPGATIDATGFDSGAEALGYTPARAALLDQLDATVADTTASRVVTIDKRTGNRLEIDFGAQTLILYDDDGVTPLETWALATEGGEPVATAAGIQTKRAAPV